MSQICMITKKVRICKPFLQFFPTFLYFFHDTVLCLFACIFRFSKTSGILLHQCSCYHHHVSASHAFQAKIRSHTEDLPFLTAAWMRFLQFYDISDLVYHPTSPSMFLPFKSKTVGTAHQLLSIYHTPTASPKISPIGPLITRSARLSIGVTDLLISTSLLPR